MEVKRPNFFIVGAPRCGTTAMYEYLKIHPQIFMSSYKEPHYFATDFPAVNAWTKRLRIRRNYLQLFSGVRDEVIIGEASVLYLYSREAAKNIKKFNPEAKILIMLRSPIEVMHSLYCKLLLGGDENSPSFEEALAIEAKRRKGKFIPKSDFVMKEFYFYRDLVEFSGQVRRYLKEFDRRQIHFVVHDDFAKDPGKVYREVLKFLNVDQSFTPVFRRYNPGRKLRSRLARSVLVKFALPIGLFGQRFFFLARPVYKFFENFLLKKVDRPKIDEKLEGKLKREFLNEVVVLGELIGKNLVRWCRI